MTGKKKSTTIELQGIAASEGIVIGKALVFRRRTMRAGWYERNGPAREVIEVGEVETPAPGPGEVLVRLHASGINPSDYKRRANARAGTDFPRVIPHSDGATGSDLSCTPHLVAPQNTSLGYLSNWKLHLDTTRGELT